MLSTSSPKTLQRATVARPLNGQRRSPGREPENGNAAMSALLTETEVSHARGCTRRSSQTQRNVRQALSPSQISFLLNYQQSVRFDINAISINTPVSVTALAGSGRSGTGGG